MGDDRQDDGTILVGRSHKPEVLTLALEPESLAKAA